MTDDLVKRLRDYREFDEGSAGASFDLVDVCLEAADRIEELTEQLEAARRDAKEAEERGAARERDACADLLEAGKEWVAARNAILHTTAPTPESLASWDRLATAEASLAAAIRALKGGAL